MSNCFTIHSYSPFDPQLDHRFEGINYQVTQTPESKRIVIQSFSVFGIILGVAGIAIGIFYRPVSALNLIFLVPGIGILLTGLLIFKRPSIQDTVIRDATFLSSPVVNKALGEKVLTREPGVRFFGVSGNLYEITIHETGISFSTDIPFQNEPKVAWPRNLPSSLLWEEIKSIEHTAKWVDRITLSIDQPEGRWGIIIEHPSPNTRKILLSKLSQSTVPSPN